MLLILIDSTHNNQTEKSAGANFGVRGYELIDKIKASLEARCPQTVSCADIIALATRDTVTLAGGPIYTVPTGRRDGLISRFSEVTMPGPTSTVSEATRAFKARGLTVSDMVVLLGAHTVGTAHCSLFRDRILNPDPRMDRGLVSRLRNTCRLMNMDRTVFLDQNTSFVFDNMFYKHIIRSSGVLQIDQEIAEDTATSWFVAKLAADNALFEQLFTRAILKLGNLQVPEGINDEIRRNCRVLNN